MFNEQPVTYLAVLYHKAVLQSPQSPRIHQQQELKKQGRNEICLYCVNTPTQKRGDITLTKASFEVTSIFIFRREAPSIDNFVRPSVYLPVMSGLFFKSKGGGCEILSHRKNESS